MADEADDPVVGVEAALQVGEEGEAAALAGASTYSPLSYQPSSSTSTGTTTRSFTSRSALAPAPRSATGALGGPPYRPPTS